MKDELHYHLELVKSTSEIEAYYIHSLIEFCAWKLGDSYKSILDIPCEYGRHHAFLWDLGYQVYGVDSSSDLIDKAKNKNNGNYYVGDMRSFRLKEEVDVVLNWFTSFGFFDDQGNAQTLKNFYDNLRAKGLSFLKWPTV
ncbi:hypothetical protein HS7_13460 [Sulfolobales archaeon HS-7]|nr:hypothetical protein HS7_13460 [Sulfolobales archaeon HS-7]